MLVFIFIAGLVSGASFGIILLSLLIAGKKNDAVYYVCPEGKIKYTLGDVEVETMPKKIVKY